MTTTWFAPSGDPKTDALRLQALLDGPCRRVALDSDKPLALDRTIRFRRNGQAIDGLGPMASHVVWHGSPDRVEMFDMAGTQWCRLQGLSLSVANGPARGGFAIRVRADIERDLNSMCNQLLDLDIRGVWNAIDIHASTEAMVDHVFLRAIHGDTGIRFAGEDAGRFGSYRLTIDRMTADAAEVPNDRVTWISFESHAYSLIIGRTNLMNGSIGVRMWNPAGKAKPEAAPRWLEASQLETDHCADFGVRLDAGESAMITAPWLGSTLAGPGLYAGRDWMGGLDVSNGRIYGNLGPGMEIHGGHLNRISGGEVCDNGAGVTGERCAGLVLNCQEFMVHGGYYGDAPWTGGKQDHGIVLWPDCRGYVIDGPILRGNRKAGLLDRTPLLSRLVGRSVRVVR